VTRPVGWIQPGVVATVQNPVTRSMIELKPLIEIHDEQALLDFYNWVCEYCKVCWEQVPHRDPGIIDASGWRDGQPAGV
jgi:hypothetical protein